MLAVPIFPLESVEQRKDIAKGKLARAVHRSLDELKRKNRGCSQSINSGYFQPHILVIKVLIIEKSVICQTEVISVLCHSHFRAAYITEILVACAIRSMCKMRHTKLTNRKSLSFERRLFGNMFQLFITTVHVKCLHMCPGLICAILECRTSIECVFHIR